jgi:hypothetical protein
MASGRPVGREHPPDRGHVRVKLRIFGGPILHAAQRMQDGRGPDHRRNARRSASIGPGCRPQARRFFARPLEAPLSPHGRARGASASRRDPGTSSSWIGAPRLSRRRARLGLCLQASNHERSGGESPLPCFGCERTETSTGAHNRAAALQDCGQGYRGVTAAHGRNCVAPCCQPSTPCGARPSLEPRSEGASERSPGFVLPVGAAAPAE